MIAPTTAPPIAPDTETVFARKPSDAQARLTPNAHGSAATTDADDAATASALIKLVNHSTAPAVMGTEMLSSSRTGSVSTSAAAVAAASGAQMIHAHDAGDAMAGRVHAANVTAAAPPMVTKATVPAIVFSRFHGKAREASALCGSMAFDHCPASVAAPSPNARTAHAAAVMSGRAGNVRTSSSTASG